MKIMNIVLVVVITLLSIAAGIAKVMAVPEEVQFLQSFGFSLSLITVYGACQILAGCLLILPKTRLVGSIITMVAFALSTTLIFLSGNFVFGLVSVVPIVLTAVIFMKIRKLSVVKVIE